MPVQFQNELVEEVKEKLSETFEVLPFSPTIENLDLFTPQRSVLNPSRH